MEKLDYSQKNKIQSMLQSDSASKNCYRKVLLEWIKRHNLAIVYRRLILESITEIKSN